MSKFLRQAKTHPVQDNRICVRSLAGRKDAITLPSYPVSHPQIYARFLEARKGSGGSYFQSFRSVKELKV